MSYMIHTDSGCDIKPEILKEWNVNYTSLTFRFEGSDTEYSSTDMEEHTFYDKMREGDIAKTSACNVADFKAAFEPYLKEGNDVLYLGFSGGLSTTCNSARIAA